MKHEDQYRAAVDALEAAQRRLGATPRSDPEARTVAAYDVEVAMARLREAKEAKRHAVEAEQAAARAEKKKNGMRRTFAGMGTPLHETIVARLDPILVAELEADALRRQTERDTRAADRRAAKQAMPPASPAPKPAPPSTSPKQNGRRAVPEVHYLRRGQP